MQNNNNNVQQGGGYSEQGYINNNNNNQQQNNFQNQGFQNQNNLNNQQQQQNFVNNNDRNQQNNQNINLGEQQQQHQQQNNKKQTMAETIKQKLDEGFQSAKKMGEQAGQKLNQAKVRMQDQFKSFQEDYRRIMIEKKQQIKEWFRGKLQKVIEKLLKKGRPGLKRYLKDPHMPILVKDIVDDIVDETWPVIEHNIMDSIGVVEINEQNIIGEQKKPHWCCFLNPWFLLRNWYLYSLQPYDKTIWYCLKTFSWYFFQIFKIVPIYSISNYFYVFIFLAIDKSDEWQLVKFILEFKGFQFLSVGALGSIIGFIQFYNCATLNDYETESQSLLCQKIGPMAELYDLIGFAFIIVLVWFAYALLPCSKPKGEWKQIYVRQRNDEDYETNEDAHCCCCMLTLDKGGRLKGFMIYDFIVFIFCCILFAGMYFFLEKNERWQQKQILYLTKTVYGLLMFPFIMFIIPQFNEILTRCRETGYNKYGVCLPRFIDDKKKEERIKRRKELIDSIDDFDYDRHDQQ